MWKSILLTVVLAIAASEALAGSEEDCRHHENWRLQVQACTEIISRDSDNAPAWAYENRGRTYWRMGDRKLAIADLKLFAQAVDRESGLELFSSPDRILDVSINTLKSYVCMNLVHRYGEAGPAKKIGVSEVRSGDYVRTLLGNQVHKDVCGVITYHVPDKVGSSDSEQIGYSLSVINNNEFIALREKFKELAIEWGLSVIKVPTVTQPPVQRLLDIIDEYATSRRRSLLERHTIVAPNMIKAANKIVTEVNLRSDTVIGDWFTAIRLERSKIIAGGFNIPVATGPDVQTFRASYADAFRKYEEFLAWLSKATPPSWSPR